MTVNSNEISPTAWVRLELTGRRVVDVDGDVVSLEFTLDLPDDKAWYQCFAQTTGPARTGSKLFTDTNPTFQSAEVLAWTIELNDIPQAARYLAIRVNEANDLFCQLLERKEMIRRQLEEAALRRTEAIASAQRLLDASWPEEPSNVTIESPIAAPTPSQPSWAQRPQGAASR
jgi:hypothetical protein